MKHLLIFWLSLSSAIVIPSRGHCSTTATPRDPFITPLQEPAAAPTLSDDPPIPTPVAVEEIERWRLQGIMGNPHQGFWALVISRTGEWRSLRLNDQLGGHHIIAIDLHDITLKPINQPAHPPIKLLLTGGNSAPQQGIAQEKK